MYCTSFYQSVTWTTKAGRNHSSTAFPSARGRGCASGWLLHISSYSSSAFASSVTSVSSPQFQVICLTSKVLWVPSWSHDLSKCVFFRGSRKPRVRAVQSEVSSFYCKPLVRKKTYTFTKRFKLIFLTQLQKPVLLNILRHSIHHKHPCYTFQKIIYWNKQ